MTREQVARHLQTFRGTTREELIEHLRWSIGDDVNRSVNTSDMTGRNSYTTVLDMILDDLPSYGFSYGEE